MNFDDKAAGTDAAKAGAINAAAITDAGAAGAAAASDHASAFGAKADAAAHAGLAAGASGNIDAPAAIAPDFAHVLRTAHAMADGAAAQSLRWFRQPIAVETKADASPVTLADRAAEAAMRALLAAERPADGIYGEEHGAERLDAEAVWVLDPIDGTRSFITGSPLWGTLIGVLRGGRVVLGVIDMPVLGERWLGHAGGATRNGEPVRVREVTALAEARIVTTSPDIFSPAEGQAFDRLSRQCAMRRFGGDCYGYAQLAGGSIDLVVEAGLQPYDYLGPCGLVEAAGGVMTDWQGRPLNLQSDGRVIAAATPALHRAALALLAGEV